MGGFVIEIQDMIQTHLSLEVIYECSQILHNLSLHKI